MIVDYGIIYFVCCAMLLSSCSAVSQSAKMILVDNGKNEFQIADIEIPFPQTDLHVRSVDREVSEVLLGNVVTEADRMSR